MLVLLFLVLIAPFCAALCLRERAPFVGATLRNRSNEFTIDFVMSFPTGNYDTGWGGIGFHQADASGVVKMADTNFYVFHDRGLEFAELPSGSASGQPKIVKSFSNSIGLLAGNSRLCCIHGLGIDVDLTLAISPALVNKNLTILFAYGKADWPSKHTTKGFISVSVKSLGLLGQTTCLTPGGDESVWPSAAPALGFTRWLTVAAAWLWLR